MTTTAPPPPPSLQPVGPATTEGPAFDAVTADGGIVRIRPVTPGDAEQLRRLAEDLPELAELDLNPVLARPDGLVAVDVKLRLAPVGFEPDAALRTLRHPG